MRRALGIFSGHCGSGREYYLGNEKLCKKEGKVVMSGGFHPKLWDFFLALLRFRSPDTRLVRITQSWRFEQRWVGRRLRYES